MEDNQTTKESVSDTPKDVKAGYVNLTFKKPNTKHILIVVAVAVVLAALFLGKGLFVAATVNGSPVSRFDVIKELEKQGGKQTLDGLINARLVEMELDKQQISISKEEIDAEIEKLKAQVTGQGGTFEEALASEGLTEEKLREDIETQKKFEKLLEEKTAVTDSEVEAYILDAEAKPPAGVSVEDFKAQIREQLKQQKFQQEAQKWVAELTANAKINYFVEY